MNYMKCMPCGKTFTGEVCYQQHLQSEKHKRKAGLAELSTITNRNSDAFNLLSVAQLFECRLCNVSFGALQNYRKHVESLEHANVIKSYTNKDDSEEMIIPCEVSGLVDEIDSNLIEMNDDDDRIINLQECVNQKLYYKGCDICNKKFSGPEPYQQHLASIGHSKKLAQNSNNSYTKKDDSEDMIIPCAESDSVEEIDSNLIEVNDDRLINLQECVNQKLYYKSCDICKKTFSGPEPYHQHLASIGHSKKLAQNSNNSCTKKDDSEDMIIPCAESDSVQEIDSNLIAVNDDRLVNLQECVNQKLFYKSCDICKKTFSGPEPYQQHLASIGHSKKLAQNSNKSVVGGLDPPGSNSANSSRSSAAVNLRIESLICKVCAKMFTGPAPYDQHMNSETHRKKVKNISLVQYASNKLNENIIKDETVDSTTGKEENNLHVQLITCNEAAYNYSKIDSNIDVPDGTLNNLQKNLQIKNSDLILPSIENLDVITTEQLNVTFFDVDSEINFDECNQGNIFPHESEEMETNSVKKCTLCNIFFKDIDDLLGHYESKEHFLKKWG